MVDSATWNHTCYQSCNMNHHPHCWSLITPVLRDTGEQFLRTFLGQTSLWGCRSPMQTPLSQSFTTLPSTLTLGSVVLVLFLLVTGTRSSSVFFLRIGLSESGRCLTLFFPSPFPLPPFPPPSPPPPRVRPVSDEVWFSVQMSQVVSEFLVYVWVG